MYLAYVKDIPEETEVKTVSFGGRKRNYINRIILVERSIKDTEFYILKDKSLLFHESWLEGITEVNENSYLLMLNSFYYIANRVNSKDLVEPVTGQVFDLNKYVMYLVRSEDLTDISYYSGSLNTIVCSGCGKRIFVSLINDQYEVCMDCFTKMKKQCSHCGDWFISKTNNNYLTDDGPHCICDRCISSLRKCNKCDILCITSKNNVEGRLFCNSCIKKEKELIKCNVCGVYFKSDSVNIKNNVCDACSFGKRIKHLTGGIREYNYRPTPVFQGKSSNNLFFGTEIELVTPFQRNTKYEDKIASFLQYKVNEEKDICYCKFDRSIGYEGMSGFEIVTQPFSWEFIISDEGKNIINNMLSISTYGCNAYYSNVCGMHVHMSKKAFSSTRLLNFLSLIYKNKDFSLLISERVDLEKVNRYSSFEVDDVNISSMASNFSNNGLDRHIAVNITSTTVEVRIFRSTLKYSRYMKNLEFCNSVYEFSRLSSSLDLYKKYIIDAKDTYPNLYEFLLKKEVF